MGKRIKKTGVKIEYVEILYIILLYIDREYYNRDKKKYEYEDELLRWVFFIYRK